MQAMRAVIHTVASDLEAGRHAPDALRRFHKNAAMATSCAAQRSHEPGWACPYYDYFSQ